MKLFLFKRIERVSDSYHSEGGLVIVANDLEHAESLIADNEFIEPTGMEWAEAKVFELAQGEDYQPAVFVFPDAGCC
jgi:hypothetical protein